MVRLDGLSRRMWNLRTSASAKCAEGCFAVERKSPGWARRLARVHTRKTGHVTRSAHVNVIEYGRRHDGDVR